jgi:hypothetical protein
LRPLEEYVELAAALGARLEVLTVGAAAKVVAFEAVKRAAPASTVGDVPASTVGDAPASTVGDAPASTVGDVPASTGGADGPAA